MSAEVKAGHAVGVAMKRKEDPRFIQGKGHYVDDLSFPGMLFMALVRSPYPHAEIKGIDSAEARLVGQKPSADVVRAAADAASKRSVPQADLRGSVEYKKNLAGVLVARGLRQALGRLGVQA